MTDPLSREQLAAGMTYWEEKAGQWERRAMAQRERARLREQFIRELLDWTVKHPSAPASEVADMIREDMRKTREHPTTGPKPAKGGESAEER
jgi:hypothetical protein